MALSKEEQRNKIREDARNKSRAINRSDKDVDKPRFVNIYNQITPFGEPSVFKKKSKKGSFRRNFKKLYG